MSHVQRRHPRFETRERVRLALDGRTSFEELWTRDISEGGMFVQTDAPPPLGTRVKVCVTTPDGEVELMAEVVHVLDQETAAPFGQSPGIGLQFGEVDQTKRHAIQSYVDGLSARLEPAPSTEDDSVATVQDAVRTFFAGYERNDLYAAIGAEPQDNPETLFQHASALRARLEHGEHLSPPQRARLERALRLLKKVTALLQDEHRRLEYDLRQGFVFAEARMEGAQPARIEHMRSIWHRLFPEKLREAEKHARTALEYEARQDWPKAVTAGAASLRFDPFNHELLEALEAWRARAERPEKAPTSEDLVANSLSLRK